jgi:catechol 2,3-dioxygenase-like lactoylglutathione lyase family enzyme
MKTGNIHHLTLTVRDVGRSEPFYDSVLGFLGYQKIEQKPQWIVWATPTSSFSIAPCRPESKQKKHDRYAPGFNHAAFVASSREEVDGFHRLARELGAPVLDPPAEYDYLPGYYAVFIEDPDGLKLEVAHSPGFPAE